MAYCVSGRYGSWLCKNTHLMMSACSALFTGAGLSALQALVIRSILQWLRTDAVRTVLIMFLVTACYWLICKCLSFASCSLTKLIPLRLPESAAVLCSEYYWKIMVPVTSQPGFFPVPSPKSGCSGPQPGRLVAPVSLRIRLHTGQSWVKSPYPILFTVYLQCPGQSKNVISRQDEIRDSQCRLTRP